jgi:hypothetical protein
MESGHPLKEPWIGLVMASDFKVDEHAAAQQCGAMLKSFLAYAGGRRKRGEAKALSRR